MESAIHGRPGICQSNSSVRGYSDIGGGAIHGWSGDCQSNSGVRGYSDIGVVGRGYSVIAVAIHGEWQSTDGPGTVRVTPVYGNTLTWGGYSSGYPWMVQGLSE